VRRLAERKWARRSSGWARTRGEARYEHGAHAGAGGASCGGACGAVRRCAGGGGGRTRGRRHGAFGYGDSSSPRHLREKLGCACVLSFPRASFGTGADPQIHRGRRTCCPLRGALVRVAAVPINGGAGEGEQGEQTGLLAAGTCGIGARGRRVGWAARRSGWSGREAHLARRSPPSCCVGDRVEEGDVAEEGWAQA
jgi:hypothetical protein